MIDIHSPTWEHIQPILKTHQDKLQQDISQTGLSMDRTEYKRGQLNVIKMILALPDKQSNSMEH